MSARILALPGNERLAHALGAELGAEASTPEIRRFPDGETYVRLDPSVAGGDVVIAASLHDPDAKLAPLLFTARTARELGARSIVLAAPYLAYMRQDRQFRAGEGVTSRFFADFVSSLVDGLVTVDPHLHRIPTLSDLYRVRAEVVHAAPVIGRWLQDHAPSAILIGPDEESRQWVAAVAEAAGAPHVVLTKVRRGDRDVEVSVPHIERWRSRTPVLVDDIISTARTMIETVKHLETAGMPPPLCIGVHAIFAGSAYADLINAGATRVATCNTVEHPTNAIDVRRAVSRAVQALLTR